MVRVRRVVTETTEDGRSRLRSDGVPGHALGETSSGPRMTLLWETATPVSYGAMGGDPDDMTQLPLPGTARFLRLVLPAGSRGDADLDVAMHRTDTLDLILVAGGAVELVLDEGEVHLSAGDHVVIQGDVHGWRVISEDDCVLVAVMLGAPSRQ
jgi:hypothetical protein